MKYRIVERPDGSEMIELFVNNHKIGNVSKCTDGYLAQGKRKPVATMAHAAEQLLNIAINRNMHEYYNMQKMLQAVIMERNWEEVEP